jgi:hypothetical protein
MPPARARAIVPPRAAVCTAGLLAALVVAAAAPRAAALTLQPPCCTRAQMEASASQAADRRIVYGTLDPASAPALEARARAIAQRLFGEGGGEVVADRNATEADLARGLLVLLGSPRENAWTAKLAPALPVRFTPAGFAWRGTAYERPGDVLNLAWPNPLAPRHMLLLVAANSPAALEQRGAFLFRGDDWRIVREGELARAGSFAQEGGPPWRYDPALDHDREAERATYARSLRATGGGALTVRAPAALPLAAPALATGRALLARMDAMGLATPARTRGVVLTLYRSIEDKGRLARETRPEQAVGPGEALAAPVTGREGPDLGCVAAARLLQLGASPGSRFLEPAGAWIAGRLDGEPFERAVARLYFGRVLPGAGPAASRSSAWRSPLVWTPARALLAQAVWQSAAPRARNLALLSLLRRDPAGSLDSLCAAAGVPSGAVATRYRVLADSLAHAGQRSLASHRPPVWRPADGFQRGVCLAHEVSLEGGYASAACARELATLRAAGAGWVSLSPFGYLPDEHTPEIWPSAQGGPEEENDESVCEAAARARALGLRVWLAPQLWTRGWAGQVEFGSTGWADFFEAYREYLVHYAVLADRERLDGLFVGHELPSATARDPARWRSLIADARALYGGTLSYAANWDEVARVPFWDALDLISVSFYTPLATAPTREGSALRAGAAKALAPLATLARTFGRPVLLSEVGYPAIAGAAVRPWEEAAGPPDPETQLACYRAALEAMDPADWLAGAFWWKWSSSGAGGGPGDRSFTPRGKPAEAVLRESLKRWQGRPVRVPTGKK